MHRCMRVSIGCMLLNSLFICKYVALSKLKAIELYLNIDPFSLKSFSNSSSEKCWFGLRKPQMDRQKPNDVELSVLDLRLMYGTENWLYSAPTIPIKSKIVNCCVSRMLATCQWFDTQQLWKTEFELKANGKTQKHTYHSGSLDEK